MFLWFESSLGLGTMSVEAAEADRSYLGMYCVYFHFRDMYYLATYIFLVVIFWILFDQLPNVQITEFMSYQSQAKYIQ